MRSGRRFSPAVRASLPVNCTCRCQVRPSPRQGSRCDAWLAALQHEPAARRGPGRWSRRAQGARVLLRDSHSWVLPARPPPRRTASPPHPRRPGRRRRPPRACDTRQVGATAGHWRAGRAQRAACRGRPAAREKRHAAARVTPARQAEPARRCSGTPACRGDPPSTHGQRQPVIATRSRPAIRDPTRAGPAGSPARPAARSRTITAAGGHPRGRSAGQTATSRWPRRPPGYESIVGRVPSGHR